MFARLNVAVGKFSLLLRQIQNLNISDKICYQVSCAGTTAASQIEEWRSELEYVL